LCVLLVRWVFVAWVAGTRHGPGTCHRAVFIHLRTCLCEACWGWCAGGDVRVATLCAAVRGVVRVCARLDSRHARLSVNASCAATVVTSHHSYGFGGLRDQGSSGQGFEPMPRVHIIKPLTAWLGLQAMPLQQCGYGPPILSGAALHCLRVLAQTAEPTASRTAQAFFSSAGVYVLPHLALLFVACVSLHPSVGLCRVLGTACALYSRRRT
jgi:hypothetical protein